MQRTASSSGTPSSNHILVFFLRIPAARTHRHRLGVPMEASSGPTVGPEIHRHDKLQRVMASADKRVSIFDFKGTAIPEHLDTQESGKQLVKSAQPIPLSKFLLAFYAVRTSNCLNINYLGNKNRCWTSQHQPVPIILLFEWIFLKIYNQPLLSCHVSKQKTTVLFSYGMEH